MFKSLTVYRLHDSAQLDFSNVIAGLQTMEFTPCGALEERAIGFAPPRGEDCGALLESVGGQWIAAAVIESKSVPGAVLQREARAAAAKIEAEIGRRPGRKEMKTLKEDARTRLLPQAFSRRVRVPVWFCRAYGLLVLGTASNAVADDVITALVKSIDGLKVSLINTNISPASIMTTWLADAANMTDYERFGFGLGLACELRSFGDDRRVVRYKNHALDIPEIRDHILDGAMSVTSLDLSYGDRVAFTLRDGALVMSGVEMLGAVMTSAATAPGDFDGDVAIWTGELEPMLLRLIGGPLDGLQDEGEKEQA